MTATTTKKRTQKEIRPMIKKDVDNFVMALVEKYPEILHSSLDNFITDEITWAIDEIAYEGGRILTNKERWGR